MHSFDDKVAIVSGSTRGIGKAIALELIRNGVCVVVNGRDQNRVDQAVDELANTGGTVIGLAGDVADADDCQRLVSHAIKCFGRLDYVVNNAGVSMAGDFAELEPEVLRQVVATNLMGACYLTKSAIPYLKESQGGVVFIGSCASFKGIPGYSIYCASKMALVGFAESLKLELEGHGVYVGVALVGFTENDPQKKILGTSGQWVRQPDRPFVRPDTRESVARQVIKMIEARKPRRVFSSMGKIASVLNRFAPRLYEGILRRLYNQSHEPNTNEQKEQQSFKKLFES